MGVKLLPMRRIDTDVNGIFEWQLTVGSGVFMFTKAAISSLQTDLRDLADNNGANFTGGRVTSYGEQGYLIQPRTSVVSWTPRESFWLTKDEGLGLTRIN